MIPRRLSGHAAGAVKRRADCGGGAREGGERQTQAIHPDQRQARGGQDHQGQHIILTETGLRQRRS